MLTSPARRTARTLIVAALTTGLLSATMLQAACDTFLHSERRGQGTRGDPGNPTNELTAQRLAAELSKQTGRNISEADVLALYPQLRAVED